MCCKAMQAEHARAAILKDTEAVSSSIGSPRTNECELKCFFYHCHMSIRGKHFLKDELILLNFKCRFTGINLEKCAYGSSQAHVLVQLRCSSRSYLVWRNFRASKYAGNGQIKCSPRATDSCCFFIIWPSERFQR